MRRSGLPRPPKGGGEEDALTGWRHYVQIGDRHYWKNQNTRRQRRAWRSEERTWIRNELLLRIDLEDEKYEPI